MLQKFNDASAIGRFTVYISIALFGGGISWGLAQSGINANKDKNLEQDEVISEIRKNLSTIRTEAAVQANDIDHIRKNIGDLRTDSKKQTQLLQEILVNQKNSKSIESQ